MFHAWCNLHYLDLDNFKPNCKQNFVISGEDWIWMEAIRLRVRFAFFPPTPYSVEPQWCFLSLVPKLKIIKNINSQKLFTGPANGEVMIDTFLRYKDPAVQELTDTTFEHLTQVQPGGLPAYLPGLTTVYREITPVYFYQWLYWSNKTQPRFDPVSGLGQL